MTHRFFTDLFNEAAERFCDRPALHYDNFHYTYRELDRLSANIAAWLRSQDIGPGSIVPVLVPRCQYMTIAALGVLRSGAGYEPLDISNPGSRIRNMVTQADARVIIASKEYAHLLKASDGSLPWQVLYMEDIPLLPDMAAPSLDEMSDSDPLVLLFTSGSSGDPKGIILNQKNIASYTDWYIPYFHVDENSRMAQYASFVFDMHFLETILPLAAGASIYIVPEEIRLDLIALKQFFDENGITHTSMTTQLGRQFAMSMGNTTKTLRHMIVGGEALSRISSPKNFTLYNGYGPTECSFCVTIFPVLTDYPGKVPIGNAIKGVEIYLLDERGSLVPDGEIGELCVAGPHVADGYLNRPDLTQKSFTPNPFSSDPDKKVLYHTGDLARYIKDPRGTNSEVCLEYMGRADRQIKIRGYRIEPAEIEALLQRHDKISDVVVECPVVGGHNVLAAYYLSNEAIDEDQLRSWVAKEKPAYMVPSFFIRLKEFPLTANGKVDTEKLPTPASKKPAVDFEEPVGNTEHSLARLVSEILRVEQVGRRDNFYLLGGNSLAAVELLYRIFETFSVRIKVKDILQYPVLSQLAERIDEYSQTALPQIIPLSPRESYCVSRTQERIYTAQSMLDGDDPTYLLDISIVTSGRFEKDIVKEVLEKLFARHESLRTCFVLNGDAELVQRILPPEDAIIKEAVTRSEAESLPGSFMLDKAPLFAWSCSDKELRFRWHHIISDGKSSILFAREFASLYNGESLSPLSVHQKEIADYERRLTLGSHLKTWQKNWQDMFSDFTDARELDLPSDGMMSTDKKAGHLSVVFSPSLSDEIGRFCSSESITAYMFLLSVFAILLNRYSRQDKIILGTVMDGRETPESGKLQGMFVNTVPMFIKVDEEKTLTSYLGSVSSNILKAMESQSVALEDIAKSFEEAGGFSRTAHGHLLFDVLFVMQNMDRSLPDLRGSEAHLEIPATEGCMYDLTLEAEKRENSYHCEFEYDSSIFSEGSIFYLARHFEALIRSCLTRKDSYIKDLEMLDEEEKDLLLNAFQPEQISFASDREPATVIELLKERVLESPDKKALVYMDTQLTYRQLWDESDLLSEMILSDYPAISDRGDHEARIALIAERGVSMIISIWAILKLGCTYVPISPSYPEDRIRYLLGDCDASLIISCSLTSEKLNAFLKSQPVPVLSFEYPLKRDGSTSAVSSKAPGSVSPKTAAYMIYTSGTTGQPKGVVVEHRQLSSLLLAYDNIYRLNSDDSVLSFAAFVFDQSVWDIFHILTLGGTLCLIPEMIARDPDALSDYCQSKNVTAASLTPAFLGLLDPSAFKTLRLLDVGGEAPDKDLLSAWAGGRRVFNTYGPTETTVNATSFLFSNESTLSKEQRPLSKKVPIGKPVPGSRVYILSGNTLCGIGVPGELCIAGNQVTRGYFNRQELTDKVFTKDPFADGRMYRSGDLARFLPDGNIDFLGRLDEQVKIRGFRIEPSEIESVIRAIPGIKDALVLVRKNDFEEDELCGYYVENTADTISPDKMRRNLEEALPMYMVPSFLTPLKALPLNINGKVDRRMLPKPQRSADAIFEEPGTGEEQLLCDIFRKVLSLDRISISDDFLSVGGDSIKAIRISSLLRGLGYTLGAGKVLEHRTIKALAPLLESGNAPTEYEEYPDAILTPVMKIYFSANMPDPGWYNQSALFMLKYNPDPALVLSALSRLRDTHGMLRLIVRNDPAGDAKAPLLIIRKPGEMSAVNLDVYEDLSEKELIKTCNLLQKKMSPSEGEVMEAALFINKTVEGRKMRLFLAFHHLVVDEVSWGILTADLDRFLSPSRREDNIYNTVSFGEWSRLLWEYKDAEAFLPEKAYWTHVHSLLSQGAHENEEFLNGLRLDHDPGKGYCVLIKSLSEDVTNAVLETAGELCHGKPEPVLLSCLAMAVKKCGAENTLVVQMESHGRGNVTNADGREVSTDRTIGWFTAVYPLVLNLADTFGEQIILTREALSAVPDFGIGYGLIFDDLSRYKGVIFNYLGRGRNEDYENLFPVSGNGLEDISPQNGDPDTISFDLRLDGQRLCIECRYDSVYDPDKIQKLVDTFASTLSMPESSSERLNAPKYSPSDFCLGQAMSISDWKELVLVHDPSDICAISRLTPLQQAMLYRFIADPDSRAYFIQDKLIIPGTFRKDLFKTALYLCSVRFDALRLRFVYKGMDMPYQIILKKQVPEYEEALDKTFDEAAAEDMRRGFEPDLGCLVRFVRCAAEDQEDVTTLLVSSHHLLMDGWSFSIFIDTLISFYNKLLDGADAKELSAKAEASAKGSTSYADYLGEISKVNSYANTQHWMDYLDGLEDGCTLPSLTPSEESTQVTASISFSLPDDTAQKLSDFLRKRKLTGAAFFGTVWALLLGMENNVNDIVFGETVSGRNTDLKEIEKTVGMLITTIPVRIHWSEETTIDSLLDTRQKDYYKMQPYESVSLSRLGSLTGLDSRLIRTLYVYENYPPAQGNSSYSLLPVHEEVDSAAGLSVDESDGYHLRLVYDAALYADDYINRLPGRILHLTDQILESPTIRVSELDRISPDEERFMLGDLAGTKKEYPSDTFLDMLYHRVITNPSRPALTMRGNTMTYLDLWNDAAALREKIGFSGERFIAVITDRSFELIVSITATLLSGACYVPIDKDYPADRIRAILSDCKPEAVICRREFLESPVEGGSNLKLLFEELKLKVIADIPCSAGTDRHDNGSVESLQKAREAAPPSADLMRDRIAYMIYTSGTTGKPKGVEIEHRSLSDMIHGNEAYFGSFHDDVVLLLLNPVFDASIQQIFPVLSQGGCLCIIPTELMKDPRDIADYCDDNKVTVLSGTNALLRTFVPALKRRVRVMITGGDEAELPVYESYAGHTDLLVNDYGPTEACVHALSYTFDKDAPQKRIPLGIPYPNKRIYVLQGDKLCGIGQKGEICIAGAGLARGYHNSKVLTDAAFVNNPYGEGLMYRTGDLGIFDSRGNLFFEGRCDAQIKIRGFRIEPAEIELSLKSHPEIENALVVPVKKSGKNAFLAAYIILRDKESRADNDRSEEADTLLSENDIRKYLKGRLPSYMIPSFIKAVDAFPLTANGKVDIKSLPEPKAGSFRDYKAPATYFEERIASMFEKVLEVDRVGTDDSFFELGGSSIELMKLLSGLAGLGIRAADVLSHPTPRSLGSLLQHGFIREQEQADGCICIKSGDLSLPAIFLIPPSTGTTLCYLELIREMDYPGFVWGMTDMKYRLFGNMSLKELESFEANLKSTSDQSAADLRSDTLREYMKALKMKFRPGDILMGYSQGGCIAHTLSRWLEDEGIQPGRIIALESHPFTSKDLASLVPDSRKQRLADAKVVFLGQRGIAKSSDDELRGGEPDSISTTEFLKNALKDISSDETDEQKELLHAFFETYLVYTINTTTPFITEGTVGSRIDAILFSGQENNWNDHSGSEGTTCFIEGSPDDHLVFLSRYRKQIAARIKKLL